MRHHRSRTDNGSLANRDAGKNGGVGADVGPGADPNRLDFEVGADDRDIRRQGGMGGTKHLGAGSPADIVLKHKVARVEIGLRADPDVVANLAGAVEAALNIGLGANEDAGADLKRLGMLEACAGPTLRPAPQRRAVARKIVRRIKSSSIPSPLTKRPNNSLRPAVVYSRLSASAKPLSKSGSGTLRTAPCTAATTRDAL